MFSERALVQPRLEAPLVRLKFPETARINAGDFPKATSTGCRQLTVSPQTALDEFVALQASVLHEWFLDSPRADKALLGIVLIAKPSNRILLGISAEDVESRRVEVVDQSLDVKVAIVVRIEFWHF